MFDFIVMFTDQKGHGRIVYSTNDIRDARQFCMKAKNKGDYTIYSAQYSYQN